jgi:hypothetical protein
MLTNGLAPAKHSSMVGNVAIYGKRGKMNTSIELKKKLWTKFIKSCESQWMVGGDRYRLSKDKEFTDLVCEVAGNKWIGGNIVKYVGEIINTEPKPEANFLKIAVYAFIWWLKEQENLTERDKGEEF